MLQKRVEIVSLFPLQFKQFVIYLK